MLGRVGRVELTSNRIRFFVHVVWKALIISLTIRTLG